MAGFPTRLSRTALGPEYKDAKKIRNPEYEMEAAKANAAFHQVSGMNLVSALAWIELQWNDPSLDVLARAEAWNPDSETNTPYDIPAPSRSGVGVYQVDYNATYPDERGTLVTIDVKDGEVHVLDPVAGFVYTATFTRDDANTFTVRIYEWQVGVSTDWAAADKKVRIYWW